MVGCLDKEKENLLRMYSLRGADLEGPPRRRIGLEGKVARMAKQGWQKHARVDIRG